jgi:hypothetical protein
VIDGQQPIAPTRGPLDSETKKRVRSWVLELRHFLEDDLGRELKRLGIERKKVPVPIAKLDYLNDEERAIRRHLDALLAHETRVEGSAEDGYLAVRREAAYTFLNRLVGLRCMEARGLLLVGSEQTEVITTKPEYGGRSRLLRDLRAAGDAEYKDPEEGDARLLRDGLDQAFRAVTEDIGVLFDPDHEYSRLWPSYPTLKKVIQQINEGLPSEVFAAPDFLGWVYQFFNVEEKERIRNETKGKPRTPYELAVMNQFYTPDWIVKFLIDNTLGRVWREMHPDTRLVRRATDEAGPQVAFDYLVPRTGEDRRQEVRQARDLRVLDPACGTMHFGQYAFALFYEMYLEELEHAGQQGWPAEPSVADREEIAAAIGAIWRNLQHVVQLGSLIQVGEDLASAASDWVEKATRSKRDGTAQISLIRPLMESQAAGLKDTLLSALHAYAAENRSDDAVQRLFAGYGQRLRAAQRARRALRRRGHEPALRRVHPGREEVHRCRLPSHEKRHLRGLH